MTVARYSPGANMPTKPDVRRLGLAVLACMALGAAPPVEPSQAVLIAHRSERLPRNAHLFVRERGKSLLPPASSFSLRKDDGTSEVPLEDRIQPLENGRLHELVPAVALDAGATYELTLTASGATKTFAIPIGSSIDEQPPAWDAAQIAAHDEGPLGPIYLVWRSGTDGLVDIDELPSDLVMSLADLGSEGYVAVQVIDFAGHRLEPREIALGAANENSTLRRVRLATKRGAKTVRENWTAAAIVFGLMTLIVYAIAKRKRHFA